MAHVVISQVTDADVPVVARLRRDWTKEQLGAAVADAGFEQRLAAWYERQSPRRVIWLAVADGEPAGMMNLALFERMPRPGRPPSRWGYLGNAFVLAAHRNQGIGRQLVQAVLDYADRNDLARLVLSPSERSIPFYQRAGFGPADALMQR